MASLGDLVIKIGGNVDGFKASMQDASASADRFTSKIAATVAEGVTLFDAYGRAVDTRVTAPVKAAAAPLSALQLLLQEISVGENVAAVSAERLAAAHGHAVSQIQATSGAIRVFEGNSALRASERFVATTLGLGPALQSVFPLIGGLAFVEMLGRMVEHFQKLIALSGDSAGKIRDAFTQLNDEARISNESLQVSNDKLENEILKIEHKPENGIKLALDEAILAADQLAKSLDKDLISLEKLLTEHKVGIAGQVFGSAPTADVEEEIKAFQRRVAEVSSKSAIPRADTVGGVSLFAPELLNKQKEAAQFQTNTELTRLYTEEIQRLGHELQTALRPPTEGVVDASARIEILTGALANLKEQAKSIGLKSTNANLEGQKADASSKAEAARAAKEALNEEQSAIKSAYAEMLGELKQDHELTKSEEVAFWNARLAEVDQYGAKYKSLHKDIVVTLGQLSQEEDRNRERDADELQKWAQKLYDTYQRVNVANRELSDRFAAAAERYGESRAKIEAADAKKIFEPKGNIEQTPITVPIQQRLGATPIGAGLDLESAGFRSVQVQQSQIDQQKKLIDLMVQTNAPIQQRIALQASILQSEIALGEAQGRNVSGQIIALEKLRNLSEQIRSKSEGNSSFFEAFNRAAKELPGALGNSLAKGVLSGKNIGQDIANSLRGIGQQMLGGIFNRLITTLLSNIASHIGLTAATSANAAATGAHGGIMLAHAGVMLSHLGAVVLNTIATVANTLWTAILSAVETVKAFFGFADGGNPPVGVPSIVGERGPELFIPREAGTVIPNHMLNFPGSAAASSLSSSSSTTNSGGNTFHFHGVQDVRGMMRAIASTAKTASPAFSPFAR